MRRELWPTLLHDVIEAAAERPFSWGSHDCCTFASACVEAMTGKSPWLERVLPYRSARGAGFSIKAAGFDDLAALVDAILGARKPALMARRGDVVLVPTEGGTALAVVDLTGEYVVGPSPDGMLRQPLDAALHAWSVD